MSAKNLALTRLRAIAAKRPVRTAVAFFLAATLTATTLWWNTTATLRTQLDDGLLLARQIASQSEALVLDSYSNASVDPIARAAQILSQGIDPRMIKVAKVERVSENVWPTLGLNRVPAGIRERWNFSVDARRFDYWKILSDETGDGIRVSVALPFPGVFGTRSQGANDIAVVTLFTALLLLIWAVGRKIPGDLVIQKDVASPPSVEIPVAPTTAQVMDAALRERLLVRVFQMHETLVDAGKHVREVVRTAKELTEATVDTRESLIDLRTGVHEGLSNLRDSARGLREWERKFAMIDAILAKKSTGISAEEFVLLQRAIAESRACWDHLARIERVIEPWTLGLDMAVASYEAFFGRTDDMNAEVRKAMASLIEENKLVTQVKDDLEVPAA